MEFSSFHGLHTTTLRCCTEAIPQPSKEFRDIQVKVHIRRPERDSWVYLGRALVSQEFMGQNSRVGMWSPTIIPARPCHLYPSSCALYDLRKGSGSLWRGENTLAGISHSYSENQSQVSDLQAEKRGNFVVISCIEGGSVVSWSLNVSISFTVTRCPLFTFLLNCVRL